MKLIELNGIMHRVRKKIGPIYLVIHQSSGLPYSLMEELRVHIKLHNMNSACQNRAVDVFTYTKISMVLPKKYQIIVQRIHFCEPFSIVFE